MKLKIEIDIDEKIRPNAMAGIALAIRQIDSELCMGQGDLVDGIRLGMRARKRLQDAEGNTIGFADIEG